MGGDPYTALGAFLTQFEADRLASALAAGDTMTRALKEVHATRREQARQLLADADLGQHRVEASVAVLRAIAGARSPRTAITPVWTMPGAEAAVGRLTGEVRRLINDARMSVVCSSFNFTPTSAMWSALKTASVRPGVGVTVYLDAHAGSPQAVAAHLPKAAVYRTVTLPGGYHPLVSHAKFIVIDRAIILLTSANFSQAAENTNIELGLLVKDDALAASIESVMRSKHGVLYQLVTSPNTSS
jgi:phosphatidylserine/phosphatidylglycerophosphate/cardiolipin synthase-like enzyme